MNEISIAALRRAVNQEPRNVAVALQLAVALEHSYQIFEAIKTYQQVVSLDPHNRIALDGIIRIGSRNTQLVNACAMMRQESWNREDSEIDMMQKLMVA